MRHFGYNAVLSLPMDTSWGMHVACISITFQKLGLELTFWATIDSIHPVECDTCKWFQEREPLCRMTKGYGCLHDWEWCFFICVNAVAVDISFHPRSWFVFVSITNRNFIVSNVVGCFIATNTMREKRDSYILSLEVQCTVPFSHRNPQSSFQSKQLWRGNCEGFPPWYSFHYTRNREDEGTFQNLLDVDLGVSYVSICTSLLLLLLLKNTVKFIKSISGSAFGRIILVWHQHQGPGADTVHQHLTHIDFEGKILQMLMHRQSPLKNRSDDREWTMSPVGDTTNKNSAPPLQKSWSEVDNRGGRRSFIPIVAFLQYQYTTCTVRLVQLIMVLVSACCPMIGKGRTDARQTDRHERAKPDTQSDDEEHVSVHRQPDKHRQRNRTTGQH